MNRRESNLLHKELWNENENENENETKVFEATEKPVTGSEAPVDKDEATWRMRVWTGCFLCHCSPLRIMVWKEVELNE